MGTMGGVQTALAFVSVFVFGLGLHRRVRVGLALEYHFESLSSWGCM
jgi:hypothetical protein